MDSVATDAQRSETAQTTLEEQSQEPKEVIESPAINDETATVSTKETTKAKPVPPKKEVVEPVKKKMQEPTTSIVESTPKTTPKPVKRSRAKMSFAKTVYDYGIIAQGDKVEYAFKFTNTGTEDLIISSAEATCGCTRPGYPFVPIAPGQTGEISVVFNSTGKLGPQKPIITVVSNAYPRVKKLHLKGFVTDKVKDERTLVEDLDIDTKDVSTKGVEVKKDPIK